MRTPVPVALLTSFGHTLLTEVSRFATSHTRLLPSVRDRAESLIAEAATSRIVNSMHRNLGLPPFQFLSLWSKKRELTILLNPTNIPISGIDADVFIHCSNVGAVRTVLEFVDRAVETIGRRLGAQPDGGEPGVKNVLDVGARGTWAFAWQSSVEAEVERRKDELPEHTGKLPSGPDGKGSAGGEGGDVGYLFRKHVPHARPPVLKNKARPRKPLDPIISTTRILPIGKLFFRRQIIEQLWPHLNLNGVVRSAIEMGTPVGFKAVAYTCSTILEDRIMDAGKAFQSPLPASPPI
ncbi:hypothetical protein HOY82DRAFT_619031 [Tuber indicum]|nr:hypothetical protein HOY82DRAFT_619031 [Tuber indicum]